MDNCYFCPGSGSILSTIEQLMTEWNQPGPDRIETKRIKFVRFNCPSKMDQLDVVVVVVVIVVLECTMVTMDGLWSEEYF